MAAPILVPGTANPTLAAALATALDCPTATPEVRRFPDGETYVRIPHDLTDHTAILLQSTLPNDPLIELLLLQDAARQAGAQHTITIIPYPGYARQDRAFQPGEAISSRALARAIGANTDEVITIDPHKPETLDFYPCTARAVTAIPQLATTLAAWGIDAILAPDRGARDRAATAANLLNLPHDHLQKTRLSPTEVRMEPKNLDVHGQRVAIVDDLIASGGTMITAAQQLKQQGATHVYAACTHGLFTGNAVPRLLAGGIDRVLCTDTLEDTPCDTTTAAKTLAHALQPHLPA